MIKMLDISEIDNIMEIWIAENINSHSFISKKYWEENYEYVKSALPYAKVIVYEDNNKIKGFIGIVEGLYIAGLFVSSKYQSKGIGSKLLNKCKEEYTSLKLDVYAKNLKAVNFYKRHGFIIIDEKKNAETKELEYTMIWKL